MRFHKVLFVVAIMVSIFILVGCSASRLHREGLALIDQGEVVEGLNKLEEAVKEAPDNLTYRVDLLKKKERVIQRLIIHAESERSQGNSEGASQLFQRVLQIDRENPRAQLGLEKLEMDKRHTVSIMQAHALYNRRDMEGAQNILRSVLFENPGRREAKQLQRRIDEQIAKEAIAGPTLKPELKTPVTLQFRDTNLKMVIEALSRSNGINILLDKDVKTDLKTTIFVKEAPLIETIDLILLQNQLEKKILSDSTILIYPSIPSKIKEYQDLIIRTFHLTNAAAKEMQTMIKTMLKTRDTYVDEKNNSLVMRDTPDAVRLAEKMIEAQDLAEPEVMLEVEVLEVSRARLSELGIKFPNELTVTASGTPEQTTVNTLPGGGVVTTITPAQPLTLEALKNINSSFFNVSPISASIDMRRETGDANILASPRIRVRNKEKAKILIGDRVPIITNAVTPVSSGSPVVTGNVEYVDVGLKLDVEPDIHLDDDVAIKVNLEVSNIVRELSSGPTLAYQIGTRSANTVLRLRDGETQVLAGLISDEDRKSAQKFPGLGDLPVLGRLFSSHKDDTKKTEIVLSITPHLARTNQRPDARNIEFWSGTDATLRSRPLTFQQSSNVSTNGSGTASSVAFARPPSHGRSTSSSSHKTEDELKVSSLSGTQHQRPPSVVMNWRGPSLAKVGDEFQVTLEAETTESLGALSFTVSYDHTALEIAKIAEGDFLNSTDNKDLFTSQIDPTTGHAFFHTAQLGMQGVTGKGNVLAITFVARAAQIDSPIEIIDPTTADHLGIKLSPAHIEPLLVTVIP